MKSTMTAIIGRQRARLYTQRAKKLRNVFIYKKSDTFQKARQFPLRFSIIIYVLSYPLLFAYKSTIYRVSPLDHNSDDSHIIPTIISLKASKVAYSPKGIVYV